MTNLKKYELTHETRTSVNGIKVFRIRALRDLPGVKKGCCGGFVDSEHSLSHEGDCWVYDDAQVVNSRITDNVMIIDNSIVVKSEISKSSLITGNSWIVDNVIKDSNIYDSRVTESDITKSEIRCSTVMSCDISKNSKATTSQLIEVRMTNETIIQSNEILRGELRPLV